MIYGAEVEEETHAKQELNCIVAISFPKRDQFTVTEIRGNRPTLFESESFTGMSQATQV